MINDGKRVKRTKHWQNQRKDETVWREKIKDISNVTHACPGSTVTSYSYTTATKLASKK